MFQATSGRILETVQDMANKLLIILVIESGIRPFRLPENY